ncbi:MAG: hypothetical protein KGL39_05450 [Patescibacteria group bacterium]|nr:hypothetical protein [Patescibacteria group bacterium]
MTAPVQTWSGPLGELRAASTAGGGTALTTTAALVALPDGVAHLICMPTNFATAKVVKMALNPYLSVLVTPDNLTTETDYSQVAQDGDTTTLVDISALNTLANGDYLLVGSFLPFRGVGVTITNANAVASTLAVKYWNGAWTAVAGLTDGTASAGATMAVSGNVTFTVPTDWTRVDLDGMGVTVGGTIKQRGAQLYWLQLSVSAQLTNPTKASAILALNRSTKYGEFLSGQVIEEAVTKDLVPHGVACIEALTDAGTANLIVNVRSRYGAGFLS